MTAATGRKKGPEGDPGTGYNKGELIITTRSLSGPRKGYPEEGFKNVTVNTPPDRLVAVRGEEGMMATFRDTVEKATVTIRKGEGHGRGVLVEGNLILTAAHCLDCSCDGSMVMNEHLLVEIKTCDGMKLLTNKIAIEPCSDIAVLGSPDNQVFYEESDQFEEFCERTTPLTLFDGFATEIDLDKPMEQILKENQFPVHIYTHEDKWLSGTGECFPPSYRRIKYDLDTKPGTSGSPIVNDSGELVGIVSQGSEHFKDGKSVPQKEGFGVVPSRNLPVWIYDTIIGNEL